MDKVDQMEGIKLSPLKIIEGEDGSVMHALKKVESDFIEFGEAYFSTVKKGSIKGWKKHKKMISNLIVPEGEIQFTFFDDREGSKTQGKYFTVNLSKSNYQRLHVSPGLWMAFKGIGNSQNMVLNLASITHDPDEAVNDPIENSNIKYPE